MITTKSLRYLLFTLSLIGIQSSINGMSLIDDLTFHLNRSYENTKRRYENWVERYENWVKERNTDALKRAVVFQDHKAAEKALQQGANPNAKATSADSNKFFIKIGSHIVGKNFIGVAIGNHDEAMVKLLLAHKADPNCDTQGDFSPLMQSTFYEEDHGIFKLLLAHGANIKYRTKEFESYFSDEKFSFNILYSLTPSNKNLNMDDRLSCMVSVMEKPECDDSDIEFAYDQIMISFYYPKNASNQFKKEASLRRIKLLNEARIKYYHQRVAQVTSKILEINPAGKSLIILPPLAKIIAQYGAEYHCMQTRPLAITTELI